MTSTQTRTFSTRIFDRSPSPVSERASCMYKSDDEAHRDEASGVSRTGNIIELFEAEHVSSCASGNVNAGGARRKEYHKTISKHDITNGPQTKDNNNVIIADNFEDKCAYSSSVDHDVWYDVYEFCNYIGAFSNKNRHNKNVATNTSRNSRHVTANKTKHKKNVVIWKDGYIVPLSHADRMDEDDDSDDSSVDRPDTVYDDLKCKDPDFPVGHEWSPEFESPFEGKTKYTTLSVLCGEFVDEGLQYESDESMGEFLDHEQDVGSRINDEFCCRINGCECDNAREQRSITSQQSIQDSYRSLSDRDAHPETDGSELNTYGHELTEDGTVSERSYYTTDSDEEAVEDEKEEEYEGYELMQWGGSMQNEHTEVKQRGEAIEHFDTPPTSPNHAPAPISGFHTAPNSPGSLCNSFCMLETDDDDNECDTAAVMQHTSQTENEHDGSMAGVIKSAEEFNASKDGGRSNNAITKSDKPVDMYALDTWEMPCVTASTCEETSSKTRNNRNQSNVSQATRTLHPASVNNRIQANFTRPRHAYSQNRRVQQTLENPPLISVHSIQYVLDPKTNNVHTVGKGSFGQVYKARFCDPRFHHLRIVVKEFDSEFTTSREVVEEAQRLHYLRDTGFVPVCYGLVNFGHRDNPRYGIVQEYIGTGLTLEQLLWNHYDLPLEMWLTISLQSCDGLDSFHRKGILLNDIKSNNIILEFYQDAVNIKYIDFGLATDMRGKRYKNTRSLQDFVYLAPEVRIKGNATTVASDVYSLGYMLEQVNREAAVPVLRFVAGLCMKNDPGDRTHVALAGDFIRNHMINLGCDTARGSRDYEHNVMPDYW